MESLDRLFGRDIANLAQHHNHPKPALRNRPNTRSLSLYNDQNTIKPSNTIHPNISIKVQRPKFGGEGENEPTKLKESLTDYFDQSMGFMLSQQMSHLPIGNYFSRQSDITQSMRTTLLDWVVDIHLKFKMFPRTLFLIAAIIDKYLSLKTVRKEELQLVGAASIFLAAKYEETYQVPQASELVTISAKVFSKSDLLRMQADIVKTLDFNLVFSTAYNFLEPFCCLLEYEQKRFFLAQYILQLALLDARFLKYRPSLLAASSIYLINKIKRAQVAWPDVVVAASGYDEKELRGCARELCQLLQSSDTLTNIKCLKRKFALPKFCQVSKIRLQKKQKARN